MENVTRYTCGAGDGMFENKEGYYVEYADYEALLDKYNQVLSQQDVSEYILSVPDIRNKLSPITHLITVIEDERIDKGKWLPKALDGAKRSVNYLAQREVYYY